MGRGLCSLDVKGEGGRESAGPAAVLKDWQVGILENCLMPALRMMMIKCVFYVMSAYPYFVTTKSPVTISCQDSSALLCQIIAKNKFSGFIKRH